MNALGFFKTDLDLRAEIHSLLRIKGREMVLL